MCYRVVRESVDLFGDLIKRFHGQVRFKINRVLDAVLGPDQGVAVALDKGAEIGGRAVYLHPGKGDVFVVRPHHGRIFRDPAVDDQLFPAVVFVAIDERKPGLIGKRFAFFIYEPLRDIVGPVARRQLRQQGAVRFKGDAHVALGPLDDDLLDIGPHLGGSGGGIAHNREELEEICDRVALIEQGKLKEIVSTSKIKRYPYREYNISFKDQKEYLSFCQEPFDIIDADVDINQVTIKVNKKNIPNLLSTLKKYNLSYLTENKYTLERYFNEFVKKES